MSIYLGIGRREDDMNYVTRGGVEFKGQVHFNDKGKPYYLEETHCKRCGGEGGSSRWAFTGWTCYECGGTGGHGFREVSLYTPEQVAKMEAARAKREAKKRAELEANRKAVLEAHGSLLARAEPFVDCGTEEDWQEKQQTYSPFIADIYRNAFRYGSLSDKQVEALERAVSQKEAYLAKINAPKGESPVGKCQVSGVIVSTRCQESVYGMQCKMLVRLGNNSTVWGTVPEALFGNGVTMDNLKGVEVQFWATFVRAEGETSFSFYKRPTKVERLSPAVVVEEPVQVERNSADEALDGFFSMVS